MARTHALASLLLLALLPLAVPATQAASGNTVPPSAPLGLAADAFAGQVTLRWEAPQEPGSPHFNRYDVLRGQDGAAPALVGTVPSNTTVFTDGGLSPGASYTYQVQAASKKATGPASEAVAVQVSDVPSAPHLSAEPLGDGRIHLQWTFPESWGSGFAGFRLYRGLDGAEPTLYVTSDGLEYYDGTDPGHLYTYQVSAVNSAGEGPRSEPVSLSSGPGAPSAPLGLQATVDYEAQDAILTWQPPADDGGAPVTQYDVVATADGAGPWWVGAVPGDVLTFTHTEFQFGPAYTYFVQASNGRAVGPYSDGVFVQATTVPSAPHLTAEAFDGFRIHLQWTVPEVMGGSQFAGFRVYRGVDGAEPTLYVTSDGVEYYDGVEPGRAYTYQVSAVNGVGEGQRSEPVTASIEAPPAQLPGAPRDVGAEASGTCVLLWWSAPDPSGGEAVWEYPVYRGSGDGPLVRYGQSDSQEFLDCHIEGLTTYRYAVSARNSQGEGPRSDPVSVETQPQPPRAPTDLGAAAEAHVVHLFWTPPADTPANPVQEQMVLRTMPGEEGWFVLASLPPEASAWDDASVEPLTSYTYRVFAYNQYGGGESAYVGTSTPEEPDTSDLRPSAPQDVAVTVPGCAFVTWSAPAEGPSPTLYWVYRATGDGPFARIGGADAGGESQFMDCDLAGLTTYRYAVSAANAYGEGPRSEPVAVEVGPRGPAAVTDLTATAQPGPSVLLAWTPPPSTPANPVDGLIVVRWDPVQQGWYGQAWLPANATQWTDRDVERNQGYSYGVFAYNQADTSYAYVTVDVPAVAPSAPLGVAAQSGVLGADVSWQEPADDGGLPVLAYTVYRSVDGGEPVAVATLDAPQASFHDGGCALLRSCEYRVTAANLVGEGDLSDGATALGTGLPTIP